MYDEIDSPVPASFLPTPMMPAGAIGGIPVRENPNLRYDEMYVGKDLTGIFVGELAHFRWRIEQIRLNEACRNVVEVRIRNFAHRILGERWELSDT